MSVRMVTCSYCNGKGVAERREIKLDGDWIKPADAAKGEAERWVDCECPRCGGEGEYLVEFVACKIF